MMDLYLKKTSKMLIKPLLDVPSGTSAVSVYSKIQVCVARRFPYYCETSHNFHTLKQKPEARSQEPEWGGLSQLLASLASGFWLLFLDLPSCLSFLQRSSVRQVGGEAHDFGGDLFQRLESHVDDGP